MDFKSRLTLIKGIIWPEIKPYLPVGDEYSKTLWEYPSRQGKYLRPGLVVLACEMFGGDPPKAYKTAAAVQLSEEWLLIHDDIEDHSEERRSTATEKKLALHKMYGEEIAINAGDALQAIMWKIAADAARNLGADIGWKVYDKLNEIILSATRGQFTELDWIRNKKVDITEEEYLKMVLKKTASYTIIGPVQLGAIIAGANNKAIAEIKIWGKWLGYIFQIVDDVLNLTVDSKIYGKEQGGDILEGKRTLITCHLLRQSSEQEKLKIEKIYNKNRDQKTEEEKEYVLSLMKKYGSIDYAREVAEKNFEKLMDEFEKSTAKLPISEAKEQLVECMHFIKDRKR